MLIATEKQVDHPRRAEAKRMKNLQKKEKQREKKLLEENKNLEICPNKEAAVELNRKVAKDRSEEAEIKEYERLRNKFAKAELRDQLKTVMHGSEQTPEEKEEYIAKLRQPDLLEKIKAELDQDHIGDDKSKLFLFCDCCTSRLRPEYRMSAALTGDTSEGKTNLKATIFRHLPDEWYIDLTRITASSLEDDIQLFNLIYFGEKGANKQIIEQIKQLVEDGMDILKKDARTDYKEARREKQPRKVGIYSSTGNQDDEELSSRYCIVSVHGNESKYKEVNRNTLDNASDVKKEIARHNRKDKPTWLEHSLRLLEDYDFVTIPYAMLLQVDSNKGRSQRDLKRFLNLIRVLAWLHQYDRFIFTYEKHKILIASPEDFYNAMEIGDEIFSQSISELEPRLQEVLDCYNELKNSQPTLMDIEDDDKEDELLWVDRSQIQQKLKIDSVNTIKSRVKKLSDMNILTYKYNKAKNHCYVASRKFKNVNSPINSPIKNLLITYQAKPLYDLIKANYLSILEKQLTGALTCDFTGKDKNHTKLLLLTDTPPVKKHEKTLFDALKDQFLQKNQKIDRSSRQVDKKQNKSQDQKPAQYDKIQDARKEIEKSRNAGYKITAEFLYNKFDHSLIDGLMRSSQLIKRGNEEYVWS